MSILSRLSLQTNWSVTEVLRRGQLVEAAKPPLFIRNLRATLPASGQFSSSLGPTCERRGEVRVPLDKPVLLTPLDPRTLSPIGEWQTVLGKDLSRDGMSLLHAEPLAHRAVGLLVEIDGETTGYLAMSLSWMRFTRYRVYLSGGHFTRFVPHELPTALLLRDSA